MTLRRYIYTVQGQLKYDYV